jgi:hypothetical protein
VRGRAAHEDEACDTLPVTSKGLERDLDAHRVADQHCTRDFGVIEHRGEVIREVFHANALTIGWCRRTSVAAIVRMNRAPIREALPQISPHVSVTTDAVAVRERRP